MVSFDIFIFLIIDIKSLLLKSATILKESLIYLILSKKLLSL